MNPARVFGAICIQRCSKRPHGDLFSANFDDDADDDDGDGDGDGDGDDDDDDDGGDDDDDDRL